METWKNLFQKVIRCYNEIFPPLNQDEDDKLRWGFRAGIEMMMESRREVMLTIEIARLAKRYRADPKVVLGQYGGQEMKFIGSVVQCKRAYDLPANPWTVQINAGDIDVIGYLQRAIPVDQEIMMQGTCSEIRSDTRVTVVLDAAKVRGYS